MTNLKNLLTTYCPNGVEYKKLKDVAKIIRGQRITKKNLVENGLFPVISGGTEPMGYINNYNREADTITVAQYGTAGYVELQKERFWANDVCYSIMPSDTIENKYLYYAIMSKQEEIYKMRTDAVPPCLPLDRLETIPIPLPPLPVQQEIVRILDHFTALTAALTAELTAELTARRKQYAYYRDELLTTSEENQVVWKTIGEISSFRRGSFPQPYGNKDWYDGDEAMPFVQVADIGENMQLVENTKRKISKLAQPKSVFAPKGSIVISLQGSIGRIAITQYDAYIDRTVAIFQDISSNVLPKYFVYQLQRVFSIKEKTARGSTIKTITKEEFTNFQVPILPLQEQTRIVSILDRFDALCNDLSSGLPAEIAARQKQYEYYRDKLLTFKEIQS